MHMRDLINVVEATYYRGSRLDPERTTRPTLSFTDDPDVASVYAADPQTKKYTSGSRVTKAQFDLKNPVDLSHEVQIDLNTALSEAGMADPSEHLDDVLKLIGGLAAMEDRGTIFHYKIINDLDWVELSRALRRTASAEDWSRFFDLLDFTYVDGYALADTKTFTRIAKANGRDGIIYQDAFDIGSNVAHSLIGKTKPATHLTYRPFLPVRWG